MLALIQLLAATHSKAVPFVHAFSVLSGPRNDTFQLRYYNAIYYVLDLSDNDCFSTPINKHNNIFGQPCRI